MLQRGEIEAQPAEESPLSQQLREAPPAPEAERFCQKLGGTISDKTLPVYDAASACFICCVSLCSCLLGLLQLADLKEVQGTAGATTTRKIDAPEKNILP